MANSSRREYLLGELRCAALRARLAATDIDTIGLALKANLLSPEQAIELARDCDVFRYLGTTTSSNAVTP
jgi:hypothetical protein